MLAARKSRRPADPFEDARGRVMSNDVGSISDLQARLAELGREFPFEIELTLVPLIKFWEREIANPHSLRGTLGRTIQAALHEAPELSGPIHDVAVLTRHQDLVEALMAVVFPPASWHQEYAAALVPFQLK